MVKTAGLYLVPISSYSKNVYGHLNLKWTLSTLIYSFCFLWNFRMDVGGFLWKSFQSILKVMQNLAKPLDESLEQGRNRSRHTLFSVHSHNHKIFYFVFYYILYMFPSKSYIKAISLTLWVPVFFAKIEISIRNVWISHFENDNVESPYTDLWISSLSAFTYKHILELGELYIRW